MTPQSPPKPPSGSRHDRRRPAGRLLALLWRFLPIVISAVLLAAIAATFDGWQSLAKARPGWLLLALTASLALNLLLAAFKLWLLLRMLGHEVRFPRLVRLLSGLCSATLFAPFQSGHLLYPLALSASEKIELSRSFECIALDKFLTLSGSFLLVLAGQALLPAGHPFRQIWISGVALAGAAAPLLLVTVVERIPVLGRLKSRSSLIARPPGLARLSLLLLLAVIYQSSDTLTLLLASRALGIDLDLRAAAGLYPLVLLLGYLPVSLHGFGVRENLIAVFFASILTYDQAIACGLLIDGIEYVAPALAGTAFLPWLLRQGIEKRTADPGSRPGQGQDRE